MHFDRTSDHHGEGRVFVTVEPHYNGRERDLDDGGLGRGEEPVESAAGWLTADL